MPETQENSLVPVSLEMLDTVERSRIELQISAARKYPRATVALIEEHIRERVTRRADIAELCYYTVPRSNKLVTGASVKLARIALACWGNTFAGAWTVGNDGRVVKARGFCWDLETNNQQVVEAQRRILDKNGNPYSYDLQVQTASAANSIAKRNAIREVLGDDLFEPIYRECMKVVATAVVDLADRRDKAMKWFSLKGVKHEQILKLLEKDAVDKIDRDDVAYLSGLANAIRDKEITVDEAFSDAQTAEVGQKRTFRDKIITRKRATSEATEKKPLESIGDK